MTDSYKEIFSFSANRLNMKKLAAAGNKQTPDGNRRKSVDFPKTELHKKVCPRQ